jgi:hypothetical protein
LFTIPLLVLMPHTRRKRQQSRMSSDGGTSGAEPTTASAAPSSHASSPSLAPAALSKRAKFEKRLKVNERSDEDVLG